MPGAHDDRCAALVVGRGPAGLTAAIALAEGGVPTVLVGKRSAKSDNRTTALLAGSVTALDTLGVWALCAAQAAPLKVMRIVDDTGRLWRAPEVRFEASEIGLDAFGYNIENRHLIDALEERARNLSNLSVIDVETVALTPGTAFGCCCRPGRIDIPCAVRDRCGRSQFDLHAQRPELTLASANTRRWH